jgi:hypothetical protein
MRARVGWTSSAAILGTGAGGIAAPIGLRSGPLGLLWLILLICGAALLLVTASPAVRGRPTGQHRNGHPHFRQLRQPRFRHPRIRQYRSRPYQFAGPRFRPFRSRPAVFLHYRFRQLRADRSQLRAGGSQLLTSDSQIRAGGNQLHAGGSQARAGGSQLHATGSQLHAGGSRPAPSGFGQPGADQPGFGRQWLSLSRQGRYQHPYQEPNTGQLSHGRHRRIGSAA